MSAFDMPRAVRSGARRRAVPSRPAALFVALLAAASPALAQDQTPPTPADERPPGPEALKSPEGRRIYLDDDGFRALFEGKTVHLSYNGRYFGSEYYKKGDRSVWVQVTQPCMPGHWYYEKPHFCFQYGDVGPFCWKVFRRGESIFAEALNGFELKVDAVDEKPLTCDPELLS